MTAHQTSLAFPENLVCHYCPEGKCPVEFGECHCCACGRKTAIANTDDPRDDTRKGRPRKYIRGHHAARQRPPICYGELEGEKVAYIPLSNPDKWAIVSVESLPLVCSRIWRSEPHHGGGFYVATTINGDRMFMHNLLLPPPDGKITDHWNRVKHDNRMTNLRYSNGSENGINRDIQSNNTSGFKGVIRRDPKSWVARIGFDGKRIRLGSYRTGEDAARRYDREAIRLYGNFAALNFPDEIELRRAEIAQGMMTGRVKLSNADS